MILAFSFVEPLLLIGVLAAAIPFVLHLLASVRAQDMMFPTLRFLRMSMEKTARRRRLQHWLLLLLRAALFAVLAIAVAEPLSKATGGWLSGQRYAAAIILDNGYSMAAGGAQGSRLERAKAEAAALLSGDEKPALAAVLTTCGGFLSRDLSGSLEDLRSGISRCRIGYGSVDLPQRFQEALATLEKDNSSRRAIYLFSDLQRTSFEQIAALNGLARGEDIHVLVVDTSRGQVSNVGIADLAVSGRRVVDSTLEFTATLVNSSATDKTVDVVFQVDGAPEDRRVRKTLRAAGQEGSTSDVRFHQRFSQPGPVSGKVYVDISDDLPVDNVRRFSLTIGGRVRALVVSAAAGDGGMLAPAAMLRLALQPYEEQTAPWPIRCQAVDAAELTAGSLRGCDIVFLCDVPRLSAEQAKALAAFVAEGGMAVLFLGPDVDVASYNDRLVQEIATEGGLLPARLDRAVGEIGPEAASAQLGAVEIEHPFFSGLYESHADYLTVLVQRHYKLAASAGTGKVLMRLANGDPLLVEKPFGGGRVVLCTTSAGPKWSNLPVTGLFLPMVARMSLVARRQAQQDAVYVAGGQATIRPDMSRAAAPTAAEKLYLHITPPDTGAGHPPTVSVPIQRGPEGPLATFADTAEPGLYRWKVTGPAGGEAPEGQFVVNPNGPECRLEPMPAATFRRALQAKGLGRTYVAPSLGEVHALAASASQGRNWWDLLLAATIIVLVFEAIVSNRRQREEAVPLHLMPGGAS